MQDCVDQGVYGNWETGVLAAVLKNDGEAVLAPGSVGTALGCAVHHHHHEHQHHSRAKRVAESGNRKPVT